MNKKQFFVVGSVVVFLLLAAILVAFLTGVPGRNSGEPSIQCSSDTSALDDLPALYPNLSWQVVTSSLSAHSRNWTKVASSTDGPKMIFTPAIDLGDELRPIALAGKGWDARYDSQQDWTPFWNYYNSDLKNGGWSREVDPQNVRVRGVSADGPSGSYDGYVKEQNGNIRAVVIENRTANGEKYFNVFVSDIIPISQIIPDYKPKCVQ
jgi:hypothetical protein